MSHEEQKITMESRRSPRRKVVSYIMLGILSVIPLSLYYIPSTGDFLNGEFTIINFTIGDVTFKWSLVMYLIPGVMSMMIGAGGGFIMYCYYQRTKCLPEQLPASVLLEN